MLELSRIFDAACIKLNLDSRRKKDAIHEMVDLLCRTGRIKNPGEIEDAIFQREKLGTTGIGNGIAIPHVMNREISQTFIAFGRKREGVKFDSIDRRPVQLIFLLLGPVGQETAHLQTLSKLSRFLNNERFKDALMEAEKEEEIIRIITEYEREG